MVQPEAKRLLQVKRMGIDTYKEAVLYLNEESKICRSEGWEAQARVQVNLNGRNIIATLNIVKKNMLNKNEAGLSEYAWQLLGAQEGDQVHLSHPLPLKSLHFIHDKIYNRKWSQEGLNQIIEDIVTGRLSDIQLAAFLAASAGGRLTTEEIVYLTRAMIAVGDRLDWGKNLIVDKHGVGGLSGNRTTPIIVPIVAAFGLTIPKTSSRAITSAAGTADVMEVLTPVNLSLEHMKKVVEQENGCLVWGGAVRLSPADDIIIRIEYVLYIDSEAQLIASILSKKIAAGSTHMVLDIPVGPTAKIRNEEEGIQLETSVHQVSQALGIQVKTVRTSGIQPIGRGVGPALEARDVLQVLQNKPEAPQDLRERALMLAGHVLEFSPRVKAGEGKTIAEDILMSGQAWKKFQAICEAQGGMRHIAQAAFSYPVNALASGSVTGINNYAITRVAKLAGAPKTLEAGVDLLVKVGDKIEKGQPLFTIYSNSQGELRYAQEFALKNSKAIVIEE